MRFGKTAEKLVPNPKLRLREQVREVMRFHHYSMRTEEAYWQWIRRYILFHGKRHPKEMGGAEVSAFLSHLTAANDAARATQQQALNALVFLYGEVLLQPLGQLPEFRLSRLPPRLPEVLSRDEVQRVLSSVAPRLPRPACGIREILHQRVSNALRTASSISSCWNGFDRAECAPSCFATKHFP
jgi:integrase